MDCLSKDYPYIELATASNAGWARNTIVPISSLPKIARSVTKPYELYRSVWRYPQAMADHANATGSVKGYTGPCAADHFILDFDLGQTISRNQALKAFERFFTNYVKRYNASKAFLLTSSGRGFHLYIHRQSLHLPPSPDLPAWVGAVLSTWFEEDAAELLAPLQPDPALFHPLQVYRQLGSWNAKSSSYKVVLDPHRLDLQDIAIAAATGNHMLPTSAIKTFNDALPESLHNWLEDYKPDRLPDKPILGSKSTISDFPYVGHCYHNLMALGADAKAKYGRHALMLRLASYFLMQSMPKDVALLALHNWCATNLGDYDEQDTTRCIETVYDGSYRFGCSDTILMAHCNSKCKLYANAPANVSRQAATPSSTAG